MRLQELKNTQSDVVAGVYGSSDSIPQFTVDSKGRITQITTVPAPSYASLTRATVRGKEVQLSFDQKLLVKGAVLCTVQADGVDQEIAEITVSPTDSAQLSIILKEQTYRNSLITFSILSGLFSAETGLSVREQIGRVAQNLGKKKEFAELARVTLPGLGAKVVYSEYARSIVATKLNESAVFIYSVGGTQGFEKQQQIEAGNCSGDTPLKVSGEYLAILISGLCIVYTWDKSCRQFVELARIPAAAADDLAISQGVLFLLQLDKVDAYAISESGATLLSRLNAQKCYQIEAQQSGYQLSLLFGDRVEIYSRRTTDTWAMTTAIPVRSKSSVIAFDGRVLAVCDSESDEVSVWERVSGTWSLGGRLSDCGGEQIQVSGDSIATGNFKQSRVVYLERGSGTWASALKQTLRAADRSDFGDSVALSRSDKLIVVGAPLISSIIIYVK